MNIDDLPVSGFRIYRLVTAAGVELPPQISITAELLATIPLIESELWTNELLAMPPGQVTRLPTDVVSIGPWSYKTLVVDMRACPDCGAPVGEQHNHHCDVARCLATGGQRLQCELREDGKISEWLETDDSGAHTLAGQLVATDTAAHSCGHDVWTGDWPGEADARRLGLWIYWGPPWIRCTADHPEATPDLNRINAAYCTWNPDRLRWDLRPDATP